MMDISMWEEFQMFPCFLLFGYLYFLQNTHVLSFGLIQIFKNAQRILGLMGGGSGDYLKCAILEHNIIYVNLKAASVVSSLFYLLFQESTIKRSN